ncbi:MAG TPA: DUF4097 family beta strand repeat-containing protein [Acidimicrobiales bacterium]|nr:DUF4097 family beta strand repeat-containing protein [Acidimicrobiales bacterium]
MRSDRIDVSGHTRVKVDNTAGEVSVVTHDQPFVDIEIDARDEDLVEGTEILSSSDGAVTEVSVIVPKPRRLNFGHKMDVSVTVRMPARGDLSVRSVSADVEAAGVYGDVDVHTVSGDTTVDDAASARVRAVSGDCSFGSILQSLEIVSVSGDVEAGYVGGRLHASSTSGDLSIGVLGQAGETESVSGDVRIEVVHDGVTMKTVSGDLRAGCIAAGDVRANSLSGDIVLGVAPNRLLHVEARSKSGSMSSDIPLGDAPPEAGVPSPAGDAAADEALVASPVDIRAESLSGDIRIVRAPEPAPRTNGFAGALQSQQ